MTVLRKIFHQEHYANYSSDFLNTLFIGCQQAVAHCKIVHSFKPINTNTANFNKLCIISSTLNSVVTLCLCNFKMELHAFY